MSRLSFAEALDQALELLEQGHPLEYCVRQFPEYSDELRPLLQVSADLYSLADVSLSALEKPPIQPDWEAILSQVPQAPRRPFNRFNVALHSLFESLRYHPVQRFASLGAALVILGMLMWHGTDRSSPDSVLYPIKRGVERVEFVAAQTQEHRVSLQLEFAQRRLAEVRTLAYYEQRIEPPLIHALLQEAHAAIVQVKQEGVSQPGAYAQLNALLQETQASLEQLKKLAEVAPAEDDATIESAVAMISSLHADLEGVAAAAAPSPTPTGAAIVAASTVPTAPSPTITPSASNTAVTEPASSPTPAEATTDDGQDGSRPTEEATVGRLNPSVSPTEVTAQPPATVATPLPATTIPAPTSAPAPVLIVPTPVPAQVATEQPTPAPPAEPTPEPTSVPTPEPTSTPTPEAAPEPTNVPTAELTPEPTPEPTAAVPEPTPEPTNVPTAEPTPEPTAAVPEPTPEPTSVPTAEPTSEPTMPPVTATPEPTPEPTTPTSEPTPPAPNTATPEPTPESTSVPTPEPTAVPTLLPTTPAPEPTAAPTAEPTPEEAPSPTIGIILTPLPLPSATPDGEGTATPTVTIIPTPDPMPEPEPVATATPEPTEQLGPTPEPTAPTSSEAPEVPSEAVTLPASLGGAEEPQATAEAVIVEARQPDLAAVQNSGVEATVQLVPLQPVQGSSTLQTRGSWKGSMVRALPRRVLRAERPGLRQAQAVTIVRISRSP